MAELTGVTERDALGFTAWSGPFHDMWRAHRHHDVEFNLIRRGWVEYLLGGHRIRIEPGRLAMFWAATPHHVRARGPETFAGWVVVPVAWLWRWEPVSSVALDLLAGRMVLDTEEEPGDAEAIDRWAATLRGGDERWRRVVELEVETRVRRLLLRVGDAALNAPSDAATPRPEGLTPSPHAPDGDEASLSHVQQMAALLSDRFTEPIGVADVAAHVALHPNYAMRIFRRHMGMTLIDYLTQQRIAEVKRRLLTTDEPLLNIAFDCGFGSASRFHEAFRRLTGTTPRRFRHATRPG